MPILKSRVVNEFLIGDYRHYNVPDECSLMVADPVYGTSHVKDVIRHGLNLGLSSVVFCSVEDLYCNLPEPPEQTLFWIKQPSTKNTVKRYSCFVEPIVLYGGVKFHDHFGKTHWSTKTGVFHDSLIENGSHPWKKPESLIEKLIRNHYPGHGVVYDPCAGSGTVHTVCKRLRIPSFSVEIDEKCVSEDVLLWKKGGV